MRSNSFFALIIFTLISFSPGLQPALAEPPPPSSGNMTLSDILHAVNKHNPTLKAAREELEETRQLYPQARAGWLPTVTGQTSLYATDIENSNFGSGTGATTKDLTLSLDQPIWRGGRTFAEAAKAQDLVRAGEALLKRIEQDIFLETVRAYMKLWRDQELWNQRLQNERILQQEYQAARERLNIGDITDTDVQQAKSRLSRSRSERIQARSNLDISRAEFEEIAGMQPPKELVLPYFRIKMPQDIDSMIHLAEIYNPELLIANYRQQAAEHNASAALRELFPQISAFASYDKQYDPQPGIVDRSETETIGLRARISLYEGGATRSRIREARHAARRRSYEIEEAKRRIRQEVLSNWHAYQAAQAQTENRKVEIKAASKALKGVREEAKMGQRTVLDILDMDEDLIEARSSLALARYRETVAQFSLAASLGYLCADTLIHR